MTINTDPHMMEVGLPKWPQMRVWGRGVSPELAREIIIRTDSFWEGGHGGNDHHWERRLCEAVGYPYHGYGDADVDWQAQHQAQEAFKASIGYVSTEYVNNAWISNAFVFGPSGWCHPDGRIHFVHNVGKWPSVQEIANEWAQIAAAWPSLDLDVCLMSGESGEEDCQPLVTMWVQSGEVTVHDPKVVPFLTRFGTTAGEGFATPDISTAMMRIMLGGHGREHRWSMDEVVAMVDAVRAHRQEG